MKKLLYLLSLLLVAFAVEGCKSKEDNKNEKVMKNKEEFIRLFRSTGRPGVEEVLAHLDTTDFFTRPAGGHHTMPGGLVQHSLEVYRIMKCFAWFQPRSSKIVVSLFHDMGKIDYGGWHTWRSVKLLREWGFDLTEQEYLAIFRHHNLEFQYYKHALVRDLIVADAISTGWWKLWHKSPKVETEEEPAP